MNNPNQGDVGQQGDAAIEVGQGSQRRPVYYWGGKMHNVPEGFKIPRMTLGSLITCWFVGDKRDGIPPLRFVQCYDLVDKKNAKVIISQWRTLIKHVRRAADSVGFRIPENNNMTTADTVALYQAIQPLFRYKSLRVNHKQQYDAILWKTVFNIVIKNKGKFATEVLN